MRQAERALFDLRRGLSILVRDHARAFVVCAVEGLDDAAAGEMQMLAGSPARLVLGEHRLALVPLQLGGGVGGVVGGGGVGLAGLVPAAVDVDIKLILSILSF